MEKRRGRREREEDSEKFTETKTRERICEQEEKKKGTKRNEREKVSRAGECGSIWKLSNLPDPMPEGALPYLSPESVYIYIYISA